MNTLTPKAQSGKDQPNHNRQDEHVNAEIDAKRGVPSAADAAAKDREVQHAQDQNKTEHEAGLNRAGAPTAQK